MNDSLDIFKPVIFDDVITKYEFHTYQPRSQNFLNNDEVRIQVNQEDLLTLPSESYIRITGKISGVKQGNETVYPEITRNGFSFLFDEVRYELNGIEIDKVRDVGIVSTLKGYLLLRKNDTSLSISGWDRVSHLPKYKENGEFYIHIPLKFWFGFTSDYCKILTSVKHELVLLRARTDKDVFVSENNDTITINSITWHMPHVQVNDEIRLKLMDRIRNDRGILMPFRRWELHELPALRPTQQDVWSVKTSTTLEKPRYVIVAFHVDKREKTNADVSKFDHCDIRNVKIYLNSETYPYDNLNLDIPKDYLFAYQMYTDFHTSYNSKSNYESFLSVKDFGTNIFYVFDVSRQNESVKSSTVDLKIELDAKVAFPTKTRAYCLVICDAIVEYTPLTSVIRKIVS